MFAEGRIDKILRNIKKLIPRSVFDFFAPIYHWKLAIIGALFYNFPSRKLKIIGVTGTKGKSTTVYMITKILEDAGLKVAAIGSLGYKIGDKKWPNTLKMTMPGRFKIQKFLSEARKAGCKYVVLEVTSEGLAQYRLSFVNIDCAVFTNLHKEHIESHGSFENYLKAKQRLFLKTKHSHVLNIDDPYFEKFANFPANIKITYGMQNGLINPQKYDLNLKLMGDFNEYNALAALAVADAYRLDLSRAVETLNSIENISGRMEIINSPKGFRIVIDYAHTPNSLEAVYKALRAQISNFQFSISNQFSNSNVQTGEKKLKLICVLGAAGGGRDKWKRPEFGKIASQYCDEIILTNEDPYDENPEEILDQIENGAKLNLPKSDFGRLKKIIDREMAIKTALTNANSGDIVVITGKGSETSMAVRDGKKIPWSDKEIVGELLKL